MRYYEVVIYAGTTFQSAELYSSIEKVHEVCKQIDDYVAYCKKSFNGDNIYAYHTGLRYVSDVYEIDSVTGTRVRIR